MPEYKHEVEETFPGGPSIHSKRLMKRSHENFKLKDMSKISAQAFCRVGGMPIDQNGTIEEPTAADFDHVFRCIMTSGLMDEIYTKGASS